MGNKFDKYPKTEVFEVVDTHAIDHAYVIGPQHVAHAADNFNGQLTKDAIRSLEKNRGRGMCQMRDCSMTVDEHQTALVVGIRSKCSEPGNVPGFVEYIKSITAMAEEDGMAGFVFKQLPLNDNTNRKTFAEKYGKDKKK